MSPRTRRILLVASFALNIGFIATAVQRHWLGGEADSSAVSLEQQLGLSAEQQAAWAALEGPFLKDLGKSGADIHRQRQLLLDEIFAAHPDETRLDDIQAQIAALQDEQQKRVIRQLLAEKGVLDADQQALLKDLLMQGFAAQATQAEHLHLPAAE